MQNINIQEDELLTLIPHRHPMVMVDSLVEASEDAATSTLLIKDENIFVADGKLSEVGIIEHIAQTAALRIGYICQQEGQPVRNGFIGSFKKFKLQRRAKSGELLKTDLKVMQSVGNITMISAKVHANNEHIADCIMTEALAE
ncbi:MAG: hydroxymyristoyl-ACP dehydratase [Paludibacteraceae bacterium]|nr:hydroxymyristoyl-ACP dehydratase [Paludibacteraceae bacterium]